MLYDAIIARFPEIYFRSLYCSPWWTKAKTRLDGRTQQNNSCTAVTVRKETVKASFRVPPLFIPTNTRNISMLRDPERQEGKTTNKECVRTQREGTRKWVKMGKLQWNRKQHALKAQAVSRDNKVSVCWYKLSYTTIPDTYIGTLL